MSLLKNAIKTLGAAALLTSCSVIDELTGEEDYGPIEHIADNVQIECYNKHYGALQTMEKVSIYGNRKYTQGTLQDGQTFSDPFYANVDPCAITQLSGIHVPGYSDNPNCTTVSLIVPVQPHCPNYKGPHFEFCDDIETGEKIDFPQCPANKGLFPDQELDRL